MNILLKATNFAAIKHKDQRRKDSNKTPYINHPIEVAHILTQCGINDIDILAGALLHDTLEDTNTTSEELKKEFGEKILNIVLECSDDKKLSKVERKKLQIEHALHISREAKLIKLADKISNVSGLINNPPSTWAEKEINGYFVWAYCVFKNLRGINEGLDNRYQELVNKFGMDLENDLEDKLNMYYENIDNSD